MTTNDLDSAEASSIVQSALSHPDFMLRPTHADGQPPTHNEAETTLNDVLHRDKALFLEKWGKWVQDTHLCIFDRFQDDYEVAFHLKRIRHQHGSSTHSTHKRVRNRRLFYMQQCLSRDYFSREAMREREPRLYEQVLGQDDVDAECARPFDDHVGLVDRILRNMDDKEFLERVGRAPEIGPDLAETNHADEVDETESELESTGSSQFDSAALKSSEEKQQSQENISELTETENVMDDEMTEEDCDQREQDLRRIMQERFVDGLDKSFDYKLVDNDPAFDNLDVENADAQDRYFDEEDSI